ncbi:MAG TPA: valine--tRNA ligase [Patescibacteria group bacterium]|nr:valine--tRNA ligase [Patescibacteria group bacterium]
MELSKTYNPTEEEAKIYELWEKSGYFNPDNLPDAQGRRPYAITMPPPNVTGVLHVGHALFLTIQDILIRFERMRGKRALWVPGTDSAAIATQAKVENELYKKENKTRRDFSREEFVALVNDYALKHQHIILEQVKKMGASCDWSRLAYTLDEPRNLAVATAFKNMFEDGLIYRGNRLVNWDPKLQTNVSDEEIEWKDETTSFYYLKYGPFIIGTARPETKFGDKYVVMHPDDKRYSQFKHGDQIDVEWINGKITSTVIKDESVDMEFGTGVMTITPAHDATDYDIAKRHNLDIEQIIDLKGLLLPIAGEFEGQHIKKARPLIIEKLQAKGLVEKIDDKYQHRLATNSRGGGIIEPQIREQWFVDVNKKFKIKTGEITGISQGEEIAIVQILRHVVESGQINIIPEYHKKIYFNQWVDNLKDWCISRQIVFGHRIPVWYKNGETYCGVTAPEGEGWEQDPDTLDTWFSSGLWTFSTLGWPEKTKDLVDFHPTDVLETGYDILFFWVVRMILMSTYHLGQVPFKTVYLHGLVRDKDRQKMSKSKGNIIDPLGVIDTYGTDALRFALVFSTSAGTDIPLAEDKIKGMKHFANKLWNISRFILMNVEKTDWRYEAKTKADKDILEKLDSAIKKITNNLEEFRFHEAAQEIYQFTWTEFADVYVETSKPQMQNEALKENTQKILIHVLINILKLLHPFMPFVTETIWQHLRKQGLVGKDDLIMISKWNG